MELWVATSNRGKLDEFKSLLAEKGLKVHSQSELNAYAIPKENGDSFEANARIKAKSLRSVKSNCWVIADDSGLEVKGLKNLPGIHSARYAGDGASDAENTAKLLKMMQLRGVADRSAQFRCVMVAYSPEGKEYVFDGSLKGMISKTQKGNQGFGYDNVFVPEGQEQTLAELGLAFKNKVSHRALAIRNFSEIV